MFRFILCDHHEAYEESLDTFGDEEEIDEAREAARIKRADLFKQVDFKR